MRAADEHSPQAVKERGQRPERDQGVHVGRKMARLEQHAPVKALAEAENYGAA